MPEVKISISLFLSNSSYKKKSRLIFSFLIFLSLVIIVTDITVHVSSVRNFIGYVLFPSQKTFSNFFYKQKDATQNIKSLFLVYKENRMLKERILVLGKMEKSFDILAQENKRLKEMLEYQYSSSGSLVPARVIGRSILDWYRIVIIDKGVESKIEEGDPVIIGEEPLPILVGQVIEVGKKYSKVLLITDANSFVSAFISNTEVDGVIQGQNVQMLLMNYVSTDINVKKDDVVLSSGLGGVFPYGIYIGKVFNVISNKDDEFQYIVIRPSSNINSLRDVFVMKKTKNLKQ